MNAAEPEFVKATLDWCNERRAKKGKEPLEKLPKGYRSDPASCPCGAATGLMVGGLTFGEPNEWQPNGGGEHVPDAVARFTAAFDNGELPQYDVEDNSWC